MNNLLIKFICLFIKSKRRREMLSQCKISLFNRKQEAEIKFYGFTLPRYLTIKGLKILYSGQNNRIIIKTGCHFFNSYILLRDAQNCELFIDENTHMDNMTIHLSWGKDSCVKIGKNCTFYGGGMWVGEPNASLIIGNNCLMANPVYLWAADGHAIIDLKKQEVTNTITSPLIIEDHVWIGQGARLLKNAYIPQDSIVASGSIVSKKFTHPNVILAGIPAKEIKRDINWDHTNPYYMNEILKAQK